MTLTLSSVYVLNLQLTKAGPQKLYICMISNELGAKSSSQVCKMLQKLSIFVTLRDDNFLKTFFQNQKKEFWAGERETGDGQWVNDVNQSGCKLDLVRKMPLMIGGAVRRPELLHWKDIKNKGKTNCERSISIDEEIVCYLGSLMIAWGRGGGEVYPKTIRRHLC